MEEMMMEESHESAIYAPPLSTSCWTFYQNPCFRSYYRHHQQLNRSYLRLPLSARKLAASFRHHLTFFHHHHHHHNHHFMSSDLDMARAHIAQLTAEIELERRLRKKAESMNKRLARELLEERKKTEATEHACEGLADEIVRLKSEIDRMKREMEEERKMLRIAEVWREERVQMKLSEARIFIEEKMKELSLGKAEDEEKRGEGNLGINSLSGGIFGNSSRSTSQRKGSSEAENPHIRRGIKGFVEFPRVVRVVGSRRRQPGSKLECQKAQLRLFLRQKNPVGLGVAGPDNVRLVLS